MPGWGVRCQDKTLVERGVSYSQSSTEGDDSKNRLVIHIQAWIVWVGAAALGLVSADTRTVGVRMQLSLGQLTLDLSKHKFPWPPPHWHFGHHRYLFKVMNTATLTHLVLKPVWAHQLNRKSSYFKVFSARKCKLVYTLKWIYTRIWSK